jgi:hypothetical protein
MNTVGKTLVIINLVFALLVAGFLVIDFATRTNWKTGFDSLKGELDVSRANTKTAQDTNVKLLDDNKGLQAKLGTLEKKYKDYEREARENEDKAKMHALEESDKAKAAELNHQRILSENARLIEEIKDLNTTLKKREQEFIAQQDASNKNRQIALQREQEAKSANERALGLIEQNRVLALKIAQLESRGGAATTTTYSPRNPEYRNPPPAYVKGVVRKIDPRNPNVAEISVGSDEGIQQNHTLEVYRLTPRPEYVGTMRIVDAYHHSALGELMRAAGMGPRIPLKEGDEVASKIIR